MSAVEPFVCHSECEAPGYCSQLVVMDGDRARIRHVVHVAGQVSIDLRLLPEGAVPQAHAKQSLAQFAHRGFIAINQNGDAFHRLVPNKKPERMLLHPDLISDIFRKCLQFIWIRWHEHIVEPSRVLAQVSPHVMRI